MYGLWCETAFPTFVRLHAQEFNSTLWPFHPQRFWDLSVIVMINTVAIRKITKDQNIVYLSQMWFEYTFLSRFCLMYNHHTSPATTRARGVE